MHPSFCTPEERTAATKALNAATKAKDADAVRKALKSGADLNAPNPDFFNYTALHIFAGAGDARMVAELMSKKANIECRSDSNETPLIMAARAKHKEIVDQLLRQGADKRATPKSAQQHIDELYGKAKNKEVVEKLLEQGADKTAEQLELESMKKKMAEEKVKNAKEMEALRNQLQATERERDTLKMEAQKHGVVLNALNESQKKVKELPDGQGKLQSEVMAVKEERRKSQDLV